MLRTLGTLTVACLVSLPGYLRYGIFTFGILTVVRAAQYLHVVLLRPQPRTEFPTCLLLEGVWLSLSVPLERERKCQYFPAAASREF